VSSMSEVGRIARKISACVSYEKEEIELMRQARDGWCGGTGDRRDEALGLAQG
jgi:hypothetical protein